MNIQNLKKALLPVFVFAKIDVRRLFRDKVAIFFVFFFPLIFLIIFGSIFNNDSNVSFRVAVLKQSNNAFTTQFLKDVKDTKVLDIDEEAKTLDQAKEKMSRGQLDATVILPDSFGEKTSGNEYPSGELKILYDQNNQQAGQTLGAVMEGIFKDINNKLVPTVQPFTVKTESTATKGLTQFDYTFSGILGFVILSLGIFGPTSVFPRLKQRGVLRRYHTTTLKVWQYFTANVVSNAIVGLISVALMYAVALLFFNLNMRGNYFDLAVVIVFGTIMIFGIGLAIGGWAKNENQAAPLAQLTTLPMMFLSGVFFPTFLMPEVLQNITKFIPLTPIVESVRLVITEGATIFDLGTQFAIMGVWLVVIYVIAFRVFRWE